MKPTRRQRAALARQLDELESAVAARACAVEPVHPWAGETEEERVERTAHTLQVMVECVGPDMVRETLLRHGLTRLAEGITA